MYVGHRKNDKMYGQETLTYSNDSKYVGEYKDDKMHSQGTFKFIGFAYIGEFKEGEVLGGVGKDQK